MAISDTQKVDYLWKKLGYAATKTDTNALKKAPNEAIASPLQLRADKVMKQASSIPSTQPGSSAGVLTVYPTSGPIETTNDGTASANRTWKTGVTDWVSPEFGSTYQVKVYIHTSSNAASAAASGTQVFATGSGNDDEWFFDYQSGVLHFIGTNLPNGVSFTGKSVYIAGARYTGTFGVGGDTGAIQFTDNRIQTTVTNEEIILEPSGTGYVAVDTTSALIVPVGTTAERPANQTGMLRFNTTTGNLEVYTGSAWFNLQSSTIAVDDFNGDNSTVAFTLSQTGSVGSVIVTLNGVIQEATNAYSVSGTTLTFTAAPASGDVIQVRNFFSGSTINFKEMKDADSDTKIQVEESADEDIIRFDVGGSQIARIESTGIILDAGKTFQGTATSAQYADLAEMYASDEDIEPGTVVCFGGSAEVQTCNIDSCNRIAGVVSSEPAYLMNSTQAGVALALQGRVPCKVTGPIEKGDMLVSAGNGRARAESNPSIGTVIGKALQTNQSGENIIEVVVGRL